MDVRTAIETRLEIRDYSDEPVDDTTKRQILDAARLAPSGKNLQHWTFILVDSHRGLDRLAEASTSGGWIQGADFAVVVLTDPAYDYHEIDAGRAVTHMQLRAWDRGIGSCIYTGYDEAQMRADLGYPDRFDPTLVAGFGHPTRPVETFRGQKDRKPLKELVHQGTYGERLDG